MTPPSKVMKPYFKTLEMEMMFSWPLTFWRSLVLRHWWWDGGRKFTLRIERLRTSHQYVLRQQSKVRERKMFFPFPFSFRTRGDVIFALSVAGGFFLACFLFFSWLAADMRKFDDQIRELKERWVGSQLIRICRSGHRIYKLRDGSHWTSPYGDQVTGPEACQ